MTERSREARLLLERSDPYLIVGKFFTENFQSDLATQRLIVCDKD